MKRTQSINLERMRKRRISPYSFKPLALAVAAITLVACSSNTREAKIYKNVAHCVDDNPELEQECEVAYQQALAQSARSGPKYSREAICFEEFGPNNCVPYAAPNGQNWFMPAVAGFMLAQALDRRSYVSSPLYTSYSPFSPLYGRWSTVDGNSYGKQRYGSIRVGEDAFKPKPAVTRTISRGGFGSTVAAKSSWGGSSSRGGWGG